MAKPEQTFGSSSLDNSKSSNSNSSSKKSSTIGGINPQNVFFGIKYHHNKPNEPAFMHFDDEMMKALNLTKQKHKKNKVTTD